MERVEDRIKNTFFKLLKKKNLDEIDVSSLSNASRITRQAFYYHFKDINDLIFSIYIDKEIKNTTLNSYNDVILDLLYFLFDDEKFNKEVASSNSSYILSDITYYFLFRSFSLYLNALKSLNNDTKDYRKILARFLANATNEEVLSLFIEKNSTKDSIFKEITSLIDQNLIEHLIRNLFTNFK